MKAKEIVLIALCMVFIFRGVEGGAPLVQQSKSPGLDELIAQLVTRIENNQKEIHVVGVKEDVTHNDLWGTYNKDFFTLISYANKGTDDALRVRAAYAADALRIAFYKLVEQKSRDEIEKMNPICSKLKQLIKDLHALT